MVNGNYPNHLRITNIPYVHYQNNQIEMGFHRAISSKISSVYGILKECRNKNRKMVNLLNRKIFLLEWRQGLKSKHMGAGVGNVLNLFEFCAGSRFNRKICELNKNLIADVEKILGIAKEEKINPLSAKIGNVITNFLHNNKDKNNHIGKLYTNTKSFLRSKSNLSVLNSDKGSVTVLMDKSDYLEKINSIAGTVNFKRVPIDPTTTIQNITNKIITTLERQNILSKEHAKLMRSYNLVSLQMYGKPKVHKENFQMKAIVFEVQGSTCYLVIPPNVINLFEKISKHLVLAAMKYNWDKIETFCNLTEEYFMEMIILLLESGYFMFDGGFYLQTVGCIMGLQLNQVLALYVMGYVLISCIPKSTFTLAFIKKYVDDLKISLPSTKIDEILQVFNSFDQKIKFKIETEDQENSVPFRAFLKKYLDLIISLPSTRIDEILQVFNSFDQKIKFKIETEGQEYSVPIPDTIHAFIKKYVDDLSISLPSTRIDEILQVFNSFDQKIKFRIETEDQENCPKTPE